MTYCVKKQVMYILFVEGTESAKFALLQYSLIYLFVQADSICRKQFCTTLQNNSLYFGAWQCRAILQIATRPGTLCVEAEVNKYKFFPCQYMNLVFLRQALSTTATHHRLYKFSAKAHLILTRTSAFASVCIIPRSTSSIFITPSCKTALHITLKRFVHR